jgi:hypothetical protein
VSLAPGKFRIGDNCRRFGNFRKRLQEKICSAKSSRQARGLTDSITSEPIGLFAINPAFDLLLDVMHHGHYSDQDDSCHDLVRVTAGMEQSPRDANGGECLHHLEVTGSGCAPEVQP